MNVISISGNVARDGELRAMGQTGDQVLQFSVADNMGKDKGAIFWNCSLFGKRAESLAQYIKKGTSVTVNGSVSQRTYTDKNGIEKTSFDVRVSDLALQGSRSQENAPKPAQKPAAPANRGDFSDMADDVPFADPMKSRAYCLAV